MDLRQTKVLLVEDDESLIDMVQLAFDGEGIQLEVASNGDEGIQKAQSFQPDLILMDVMMPGMSGFEATQKIKSLPETKNIPVFFLTAKSLETDIKEGKKSGGELYLVKPFSPFELIQVIKDYFQSRNR